jgi:RND family efflux transporter MFP subunit
LLRTTVADKDAVKLNTGESAWVSVDAWPDKRFAATVNRIAGMADPLTGAFDVELALDALPRNVLRSGMIGRADINVKNDLAGVLVPVSALIDIDKGAAKFYVVEDGKARLRAAKVLRLLGENVVMSDGVAMGDSIIVAGAPYVNDQQTVMLVTE